MELGSHLSYIEGKCLPRSSTARSHLRNFRTFPNRPLKFKVTCMICKWPFLLIIFTISKNRTFGWAKAFFSHSSSEKQSFRHMCCKYIMLNALAPYPMRIRCNQSSVEQARDFFWREKKRWSSETEKNLISMFHSDSSISCVKYSNQTSMVSSTTFYWLIHFPMSRVEFYSHSRIFSSIHFKHRPIISK